MNLFYRIYPTRKNSKPIRLNIRTNVRQAIYDTIIKNRGSLQNSSYLRLL